MSPIDRNVFFTRVRAALFGDDLRQTQVAGLNAILDGWEAKYADKDPRWLAYALATAYHETARTMQPIAEFGKGRGRPYGKRFPQTGEVYYGRGFVQLTWYFNYEKMTQLLGVDLFHHPELALDPAIAADVMFIGMIDGVFTGKSLANFFDGAEEDWVHARRIVNGLDKAQAIAGYGRQFFSALNPSVALPAPRRDRKTTERPAAVSSRTNRSKTRRAPRRAPQPVESSL